MIQPLEDMLAYKDSNKCMLHSNEFAINIIIL